MPTTQTPTIRVDFTSHDRWVVTHSGRPADSTTFSSILEARSAGQHIAEAGRPSELVVCNAYHDVIELRSFPAPAWASRGVSACSQSSPTS
jgi:hypothetical protein